MFPQLTQERINESLGSGVIVDAARGLILTNHHVIEGADEVSVTLSDERTFKAEFVGSDPDTDVAVMRIKASNLSALPLADSSQLKVGDFVVAVGNPFGIGQTVTSGSCPQWAAAACAGWATRTSSRPTPRSIRAIPAARWSTSTASWSASTPPASIRAVDGRQHRPGLRHPTSIARGVLNQLVATGEVRRGTLGLEAQDVDPRLAQGLGLGEARGAAVTRVFSGSAAAAAGLKPGDVIVGANGERIDDRNALRNFEGLQSVGSRATLDVVRDGKPLQLSASLREQPRRWPGPNSIRAWTARPSPNCRPRCASPAPVACWSRRWPAAAAPPATACRRATWWWPRPAATSTTCPASAPASHGPPQGWCSVSSVAAGAAISRCSSAAPVRFATPGERACPPPIPMA
jgi:S1-C subfamily serine protease